MTERKAVADRNYRLAAERVADGRWRVDAAAGLIYDRSGRQLGYAQSQGYTYLGLYDPQAKAKRHAFAHRVIWESVHGPIPDNLVLFQINHINSVRNDNRLANLELVTSSQNAKHAHTFGLAEMPKGEDAPWSRLTAAQVDDIRRRYLVGESQPVLAKAHGISRQHVSSLVNGTTWAVTHDGQAPPTRAERAAVIWPEPPHGTFRRYQGGTGRRWQACRCDACRAANTEHARQIRAKRKTRLTDSGSSDALVEVQAQGQRH